MANLNRVESRAVDQLMRDVVRYSEEKNKDARYALYIRARDVAFKLRKLYEKEAPEKSEMDDLGYNVKVRAVIRKKYGVRMGGGEGAYAGAVNYRVNGNRITNKRARAVHAELGVRRRSRLWLRNAVPILPFQNEELFFKTLRNWQVAKSKTRADKRGGVIGDAVVNSKKKQTSIRITSRADAAELVSNANGDLLEKAVRGSSEDVRGYLGKSQGRAIGRTLKKVYRS